MPTLPLPPFHTGGIALDGGALAVGSVADVAAEWSQDLMQDVPVAPKRDAIQAGELNALLAYQRLARYAAAQSDPLRATDVYLDEIGGEHSIFRAQGDTDVTYRQRIVAGFPTVDPVDIIAVANAALAPYTNISCRYAERSDGLFLSNPATTTWSAHLFHLAGAPDGGAGATPNYPDRQYTLIPNRRPFGAMLFESEYGRIFVLRVPDISGIDNVVAALYQLGSPAIPETPVGGGFFLGVTSDGVNAKNVTFLEPITATSAGIYQSVVDAVEAIRGHGIRWTMISDANLTA